MSVAIFTTYAPSEGFGGPARVLHQRRVLEHAGHPVIHVVLQARRVQGDLRQRDVARVVERPHRGPIDHIYHDVDLGRRASADHALTVELVEHLRVHGTRAIILEQPFLVEIAEHVASALSVPIVYSCQNIEYALRRDLERFQFDWRRPLDRADEVRELECRAVSIATAVTSICATDQDALRTEFGVESTLVPNGTAVAGVPLPPSRSAELHAGEPIDFAFAGSSYWPNLEGFARFADPSLAFLPPTARVHVAGSVCGQLLAVPAIARHHSVNASRIVLRGFLEMDDLVAAMWASRAVLVPVFIGEGSNLKSADALASGRPVVMTRRATRGYEDVIEADPEGVTVVDEADEFRRAVLAAFRAPRSVEPAGRIRRTMLTWPRRLQPLVRVVDDL